MKIAFLIFPFIALLGANVAYTQTKNEKEERITLKVLPNKAQLLVAGLPKNTKRLKFYRETDGTNLSYEAKFQYNKKKYSLEFNTNGIIEDIEVIITEKQLPKTVKTKIRTYFNSKYSKTRLIKLQQQFVNNSALELEKFITQVLKNQTAKTINYEVIAEVSKDKKRNLGEFTFNATGDFVSYRAIILPSYGHVLY